MEMRVFRKYANKNLRLSETQPYCGKSYMENSPSCAENNYQDIFMIIVSFNLYTQAQNIYNTIHKLKDASFT